MENKELFEYLSQLQQSLRDIEAARQMVDDTVHAYNEVSVHIKSYSEQLSAVSKQINLLITQIGKDTDTLSSNVDAKIETILEKAERISDTFAKKTSNVISSFENSTRENIQEVNTSFTNIVGKAQEAITQSVITANELQSQSVITLESTASKIDSLAQGITNEFIEQLDLFKKRIQKTIIVGIVLIFCVVICCFAVLFFKG